MGTYLRLGVINFFHFLGGCLFEVGTNLRLGAKSNKYCMKMNKCLLGPKLGFFQLLWVIFS